MSRLNHKAWKILRAEVEKCAAEDRLAGETARNIALKRLKKLRYQKGKLAEEEELRQEIADLFPNFSNRALKAAAKANRPSSPLAIIPFAIAGCAGFTGLIWVLNLPYPMIRRPVAQTAPILLLPSYISMDRNYKEAIANVEGAAQLIERATSAADIELGAEKVKIAQKNLDSLPVWFLGYEPQFYCAWFSCSWKFTFDEFQSARANVGRMEAKVFQEKNALTQLQQSESALKQAKQTYQQASIQTDKQKAIATWQTALDELVQLPSATLAGQMASTRLEAYRRDFQQVAGLVSGSERNNTMISVAKQFALRATISCQNSPHSVLKWQKCQEMWQQAMARLEMISADDPGYVKAQTLLATYQSNLNDIEIRQQTEADAIAALEAAQAQTEQLRSSLPEDFTSINRNYIISQLQAIIHQLKQVQPGTTAYSQAQELLNSAQNKLKQLEVGE